MLVFHGAHAEYPGPLKGQVAEGGLSWYYFREATNLGLAETAEEWHAGSFPVGAAVLLRSRGLRRVLCPGRVPRPGRPVVIVVVGAQDLMMATNKLDLVRSDGVRSKEIAVGGAVGVDAVVVVAMMIVAFASAVKAMSIPSHWAEGDR